MNTEDSITQEEYEQYMMRRSQLQGIPGIGVPPSEMTRYIEALAEDYSFRVNTENGNIESGTVPIENKNLYWATNSKNMKWANLDKQNCKKIKLTNLNIRMCDMMYEINPELARKYPELKDWAIREVNSIKNNLNQRVQTDVNISRGMGGFERKQLGTNSGQFGSENPQAQKQGIMGKIKGFFG